MDAPVPLIAVALLAVAAVLAPTARARALAMLAALALTPAILIAHIADTDQFQSAHDHPAVLAALAAAGLAVVAALALLFHRRPEALPVAAVFALPFRIPIAVGGSTSNLLVPLYLVVGRGRARLRGAAAERAVRRLGASPARLARAPADGVRRALRHPGLVLRRLRSRARAGRVLLRAVRAAVRAAVARAVDAAPGGDLPGRARRRSRSSSP